MIGTSYLVYQIEFLFKLSDNVDHLIWLRNAQFHWLKYPPPGKVIPASRKFTLSNVNSNGISNANVNVNLNN